MTRTAVAADDIPDPEPIHMPRRFSVVGQATIGRVRDTVWAEYASLHHPAWSDFPGSESPMRSVGELRGLVVGAAFMGILPAAGAFGVRGIIYGETTAVDTGYFVEHHSICTGAFEMKESLRLLDHPNGGTWVQLTYWVDTIPMTQTRADRLQHNLRRMQSGYLERARHWRLGDSHQPNIVAPEPEDLPFKSH